MSDKTDTAEKHKHEDWPNRIRTRDELDSALEAGLESGVSPRSFDEIIESAKARLKNS